MKWFVAFTVVISFLLMLTMPVSVIETNTSPSQNVGAQAVAAVSTDPYEKDFLDSLNQLRVNRGLSTVSYSQALASITSSRATDMVDNQYYAHTHPVSGTDFSVYLPAGSGFACENLLLSATTDQTVVLREWLASPSHAQCLLQPQVQFASLKQAEFIETDQGVQYLYVFITSTR